MKLYPFYRFKSKWFAQSVTGSPLTLRTKRLLRSKEAGKILDPFLDWQALISEVDPSSPPTTSFNHVETGLVFNLSALECIGLFE